MQQTVACYTTSADDLEVRAAIVLHLDPKLSPEAWMRTPASESLPAASSGAFACALVDYCA
jgi:hypothetical protein